MSNLPAPFDPNLLPAIHHGYSLPYSQSIFLLELELPELPAFGEPFKLVSRDGVLQLEDKDGAPAARLDPTRSEVLGRLLEAGKQLVAERAPGNRIRISLQEL
jgi:hypothetical protein